MIINKKENFTSFINPDTSILANHMDFSIVQHAYFEFSDEVIAIHHNKNFLNTNLLYYIFEGGGTTFFNDEEIPILPGKIYFHPCVKQKEYKSVFVPGTKKVHIRFFCKLYSERDIFSDIHRPMELEDTFNVIPFIKDSIISKNPGKQFLLTAMVQLTLAPVFAQVKHTLSEQLIKGKKHKVLFDFIEKNLYIDTTIKTIEKETGYSTYMLTHTIPSEIGFSIKKYITNKIFELILFELVYTENLFRQIAEKYHFSSEAHFSNWFLARTGMRPKEYRLKYRPENNYSFYENYL